VNFRKFILKKTSDSTNLAFLVSRRRFFINLSATIASALLMTFSIPPLGLSFLAFFAMVPLLLVIFCNNLKPVAAAGYSFVYGSIWGFMAFFWLREIDPVIPWLMGPAQALFIMAWGGSVSFLTRYILTCPEKSTGHLSSLLLSANRQFRQFVLAVVIAATWCLMEWSRSWVLPWNYFSTAMWNTLPLIQVCRFTGTYGISFLLMLFNVCLTFYIMDPKFDPVSKKVRRPWLLIIAVVMVVMVFLEGIFFIVHQNKRKMQTTTFRAGLVQGDISQRRKADNNEALEALDIYLGLSKQLLSASPLPDIVIWPETAVPYPYRAYYDASGKFRRGVQLLARKYNTPFMFGTIDFEDLPREVKREPNTYNSAFLVKPAGDIAARYHKVQRVPWGEYIPGRSLLPQWIIKIIDMHRDLTPGTSLDPISILPGVRAGVSICFESVFPFVSRGEARRGANLLVVLSNDAWYPTSSEPAQHLANAIFRSIETGLPQLRCGNNSTSCLISPTGYISDCLFKEADEKTGLILPAPNKRGRAAGVIPVQVEKDPRPTFFVRNGNLFILFCWIVVLAAFSFSISGWRSCRTKYLKMFTATERK